MSGHGSGEPDGLAARTIAARGVHGPDEHLPDVAPPIRPSTTFVRDERRTDVPSYARSGGPATAPVEATLAALEGGADARLFASGMAASVAVMRTLRPGQRVLAPREMYWGFRRWLEADARAWGLDVAFADMTDLAAVATALDDGDTALVWIETPGNPTWSITDIAGVAELAHARGARLVADSTVATPVFTRPIEHGADLVVHAATKALNGHSDVTAGVVVTARTDDAWSRLDEVRAGDGGVLGGFDAWLLERGLRTLFLRVPAASASALALAEWLAAHPAITRVYYPGLPSHPGHAVARRQMTGGFGSMLSIQVRGGEAGAARVVERLRLFLRATSLGGVESLVEHRARVEGPHGSVPPDLLRLSVGIESVDDLRGDLERALGGG